MKTRPDRRRNRTRPLLVVVLAAHLLGCGSSSPGATRSDGGIDARSADGPISGRPLAEGPFGFHPGTADGYSLLQDLGATWSRDGMYFVWDWIDARRDGELKFKSATVPPKEGVPGSGGAFDYDAERIRLNPPAWVHVVVNVCPFRMGGEFATPEQQETYRRFIVKLVERYDGDGDLGCTQAAPDCYAPGDKEHPSQALIDLFKANPVKHWQLCNQLTDTCEAADCKTSYATKYAAALRLTYQAVKEADSSASVLMAGDSARDLYGPVFKELGGEHVDIIDFHRFGEETAYDPAADFDQLKLELQASGFELGRLRFWITETSTYSGDPVDDRTGGAGQPYQSEKQQARGLLKIHVAALAHGIERIFWAWSIVEGFGCECCIFDYTGLVYDGNTENSSGCDASDPYDQGVGVKKLGYYTYKLMVERLGGSTSVETLRSNGGVRLVRFTRPTGPVWVAWNDSAAPAQVVIPGVSSSAIRITEAIPAATLGKEVTAYASAFATTTQPVSGGNATVTVADVPLIIAPE